MAEDDLERVYADAYAAAYATGRATLEGRTYADTENPHPAPAAQPDAPEPPPRTRGRAGVAVLAFAALLVVCLVALAVSLRHPSGPETRDVESGGPGTSAPLTSLPAGVSLPPDGSYSRTRVLPDGDLQVDEWIRSRSPLTRLRLSTPRVAGLDPGSIRTSRVALATGSGPAREPSSGSGVGTYRFERTHSLRLRYVLSGAVQRSPSAPGRALARVVGLDVGYPHRRGPRTVTVVAAEVLALACSRPGAAPEPCGRPGPGSWAVHLDGARRADRVMAQVTLG